MNKKTVKIIRLIILVICIGLLVAGGYMFYKQQIAPLRKHLNQAKRIREKSPHLYELLKLEHELENRELRRNYERNYER